MSDDDELLETIEDLVRQFACHTVNDGVPAYSTGGLSAMERAFEILGWGDPHPAPEMACERLGCSEWATCGTPTDDGYKRLCSTHYRETWATPEVPALH